MSVTSTPFQTGRTENIRLDVRDLTGSPLTGATGVQIRIQRASDGQLLDFDDLTFKPSGWVEKETALTEIDATELPGIYELSGGLDSSAVTNLAVDDTYLVIPVNSGAPDTSTALMPAPGEFKIGWLADRIGVAAHVSATIGSRVTDTLELMAWLSRDSTPVTSGLTGATVEIQDSAGTVIVASGAMSGPNAAGIFERSVSGVSLSKATNYVAILTVTDALGAQVAYTAMPTVG